MVTDIGYVVKIRTSKVGDEILFSIITVKLFPRLNFHNLVLLRNFVVYWNIMDLQELKNNNKRILIKILLKR